MSQLTVVVRTTKILPGHDQQGNQIKEVIDVKLPFNSVEYLNYFKHVHSLGLNKVEFVKFTDPTGKEVTDEEKAKEVIAKCSPKKEVPIDPRDAELQELREAIKELQGKAKTDSEKDTDPELAKARQEYKDAFDKKPHHSWSIDQINEKIQEFRS